ncbi:unnamed protein product [Chironomus riparius]|uniref:Uncharacterized protein n=1 Tax=Chironomus riparius TaxID=315576 RepID=A0A9N9RP09_9DIPT|nr:unnamed protein product [Chironomus riparius]
MQSKSDSKLIKVSSELKNKSEITTVIKGKQIPSTKVPTIMAVPQFLFILCIRRFSQNVPT